MGAASSSDEGLPDDCLLPCYDTDHWAAVARAWGGPPVRNLEELQERMAAYSQVRSLSGLRRALACRGAAGAAGAGGWPGRRPDGPADQPGRPAGPEEGTERLFASTLPHIVRRALALPGLSAAAGKAAGPLRHLRQGRRARQVVPRELGASLLANMILCTFDKGYHGTGGTAAMPDPSFLPLLANAQPQEVAKLQMFLHFFDRVADKPLQGSLVVDRVTGVAPEEAQWLASDRQLLGLKMSPPRVGFETAPELAHADFANMFLGGGVLAGGCVQEEIRFSICPELCVPMLFCPCMQPQEAIQIVGAEQFSAYEGYGRSLRFGGPHQDQAKRAPDGAPRTAILAMDALDFRGQDSSLHEQMAPKNLLRELDKALAAFTPVDKESLDHFPVVATGNWGCGAFGGCAPLKALLQWASASQCNRRLQYFPYDEEELGPNLAELARRAVEAQVTVGALLQALWDLKPARDGGPQPPLEEAELLGAVARRLGLATKVGAAPGPEPAGSSTSTSPISTAAASAGAAGGVSLLP